MAVKRASLMDTIRKFFRTRKVIEVDTPLLSLGVAVDAFLEPFSLPVTKSPSSVGAERFLQTSPEFHMKRLLASGFADIFQICHAFRSGEEGRFHNPEFCLLEWYRIGFDMQELMQEVIALLLDLLGDHQVQVRSFQQAFYEALDSDILDPGQRKNCLLSFSHQFPKGLSEREQLIFILDQLVIPHFSSDGFVLIHDFPVELACLAQVDSEDPRVARRFEVYAQGVELGNGYQELRQPEEQRARFEAENRIRVGEGRQPLPLDDRFLASLNSLPPCSGVAVGIDRIFMLQQGLDTIHESIPFPWSQA